MPPMVSLALVILMLMLMIPPRARCRFSQYWDVNATQWSRKGCLSVGKQVTPSGIALKCMCFHLTEFGGLAEQPVSKERLFKLIKP